jgi:copper homeostasis protein
MNNHILEACVETMAECRNALENGADQLEVCSRLDLDGLTPDMEVVRLIIEEIKLPVKVMIRCRGGNFIYSEAEIDEMVHSVASFKPLGVHGFVFGALSEGKKNTNTIDMSAIYKICREAAPYPVTVHKAIDLCDNMLKEVIKLKSVSNVHYILSSGGQPTAELGANMLYSMQKLAQPEIEIIAAGKINKANRKSLEQKTKLRYYHGRQIVN